MQCLRISLRRLPKGGRKAALWLMRVETPEGPEEWMAKSCAELAALVARTNNQQAAKAA